MYDVGDGVQLRHEVRNAAGALTAATVTVTVTAPDGTVTTPTVSTTSTGIYDAIVVAAQAGLWTFVWSVSGTVTDTARGQFTASATPPRSYVDLPLLKAALGVTSTDAARDELLLLAAETASRQIEDLTGRRFHADGVPSTRVFRTSGRVNTVRRGGTGAVTASDLLVDDIASTSGLLVETGDGATWTSYAGAYVTAPDNALSGRQAITGLRITGSDWTGNTYVRVTARWGWPDVPAAIRQAVLIQATRLYKRRDSPEGVVGVAEWGTVRVTRTDPDVMALIAPYMLPGFA